MWGYHDEDDVEVTNDPSLILEHELFDAFTGHDDPSLSEMLEQAEASVDASNESQGAAADSAEAAAQAEAAAAQAARATQAQAATNAGPARRSRPASAYSARTAPSKGKGPAQQKMGWIWVPPGQQPPSMSMPAPMRKKATVRHTSTLKVIHHKDTTQPCMHAHNHAFTPSHLRS